MKKIGIITLIIICILSVPLFASSETFDIASIPYSDMTTDDLHLIIQAAKEELTKRNAMDKDLMVIVDTEDFFVYLDSDPVVEDSYNGGKVLELHPVVENRSSSSLTLLINNVYVNNWKVDAYHGEMSLEPGKKVKSFMDIYDVINSIDELDEIEFDFSVWNDE